ncbi:hypothetical protein NC652_029256 [Populus alba x Populus x berolinensis]|nr:hypothetical protein NC652_029256 [Populus alba x Populus x berolinensis]
MLNLLPEDQRIHSRELKERIVKGEAHVLVDVRSAHHFKIVSLPNAMNIPLSSLESRLAEISSALKEEEKREHGGFESEQLERFWEGERVGREGWGCWKGGKGRGRVSGVERFWGKGKGVERFWRGGGGLEKFCRVRVFII